MQNLIERLRLSWDIDTAAPGTAAAGKGKPHGQCAVTALVVQQVLGGTILRSEVLGAGHYWNLIPGVGEIDLTREQFDAELLIPRGVEVSRSRLLDGDRARAARTGDRFNLLALRMRHVWITVRP